MAQISSRGLAANAVSDAKIDLSNASYLRARNFANSADINIVRVNASNVVEFPSVPQITGTPSAAADVVNVSYASALISNLVIKNPVRAIATSNITLSAPQTIDGVSLLAGDRVLVAGQTTASANGIYIVAAAAWSRSSDFSSASAVYEGNEIPVAEGTVYQNSFWQLNSTGGAAVVIGTTSLGFTKIGPGSVVPAFNKQRVTLSAGDITNQYYDLAQVIKASSLDLAFNGLLQSETSDYTVSLVGGTGGVTRISFTGDIGTGGASALLAGDIINFKYQY